MQKSSIKKRKSPEGKKKASSTKKTASKTITPLKVKPPKSTSNSLGSESVEFDQSASQPVSKKAKKESSEESIDISPSILKPAMSGVIAGTQKLSLGKEEAKDHNSIKFVVLLETLSKVAHNYNAGLKLIFDGIDKEQKERRKAAKTPQELSKAKKEHANAISTARKKYQAPAECVADFHQAYELSMDLIREVVGKLDELKELKVSKNMGCEMTLWEFVAFCLKHLHENVLPVFSKDIERRRSSQLSQEIFIEFCEGFDGPNWRHIISIITSDSNSPLACLYIDHVLTFLKQQMNVTLKGEVFKKVIGITHLEAKNEVLPGLSAEFLKTIVTSKIIVRIYGKMISKEKGETVSEPEIREALDRILATNLATIYAADLPDSYCALTCFNGAVYIKSKYYTDESYVEQRCTAILCSVLHEVVHILRRILVDPDFFCITPKIKIRGMPVPLDEGGSIFDIKLFGGHDEGYYVTDSSYFLENAEWHNMKPSEFRKIWQEMRKKIAEKSSETLYRTKIPSSGFYKGGRCGTGGIRGLGICQTSDLFQMVIILALFLYVFVQGFQILLMQLFGKGRR
eukprot:TRINITY_DN106321_c0_g1_i1.p1 TRINITY_DN106321_c0_g1~~TRINITY_DN106321_c0_g1_i1.p1  ORF type:complete len:571 (-),score=56.13 TRINITY_DN106321_c0_g1_i1:313-2025(-)